MWGHTESVMVNGLLDEVSRLKRERDSALDSVLDFMKNHPEFEEDPHLCEAAMALL